MFTAELKLAKIIRRIPEPFQRISLDARAWSDLRDVGIALRDAGLAAMNSGEPGPFQRMGAAIDAVDISDEILDACAAGDRAWPFSTTPRDFIAFSDGCDKMP